ncbi:hypothetical protein AAG906_014355 [Vitis piasezkii]
MTTSRPIKPRKVGCCSLPGAVCEDPRLVGGDGITFYLHGSKDQDFCLVSNANLLRINAHFMGTRNPNLTRDFTGVCITRKFRCLSKITTIIRRLDDLEAKKVQKFR